MLRGKIDPRKYDAIAGRLTHANKAVEHQKPQQQEPEEPTMLQDLMLQAEILVQYGMRSKAVERLQRIQQLFPHEEEKNEQREWSKDEKGHPLLPAARPGKEAEKPAPSAPRSGAPGLSLPFLRDGHSYPGPIPTRESATGISDRSKNFVGVAV